MADTDPNCIFCKIVRREIPTPLVAESAEAVAFRDLDPKAPVHVLVIPRRHVPSLAEAQDAGILGAVLELAADVARQEGIVEKGFRTVINTGGQAGQTVPHLHAHVLGGRHMAWPPG
ncbi:MAG TPA: histidine triad nucleotide-binding protein [Candidatus Elarobacter sp.]|nr:histidine triad nucleotide-binding protein [Candidatus Elarobacter sp.]